MRTLIVAGLACIVGIAGVVGLTRATVDTAPADRSSAASAAGPSRALALRVARLRQAERAADDALRRVDVRSTVAAAVARPVVVRADAGASPSYGPARHDEVGERHDGGGQGGRHGEDD